MSLCRYLEGENIAPKTTAQARALIGKQVKYLQKSDIDRSGRGYFFPRQGIVTDVKRKDIDMNNSQAFDVSIGKIVEMCLVEETTEA